MTRAVGMHVDVNWSNFWISVNMGCNGDKSSSRPISEHRAQHVTWPRPHSFRNLPPRVHALQFGSFLTDLTQTMSSKLLSSLNISRSFGATFLHALSAHTQLMLVKEHVIV